MSQTIEDLISGGPPGTADVAGLIPRLADDVFDPRAFEPWIGLDLPAVLLVLAYLEEAGLVCRYAVPRQDGIAYKCAPSALWAECDDRSDRSEAWYGRTQGEE